MRLTLCKDKGLKHIAPKGAKKHAGCIFYRHIAPLEQRSCFNYKHIITKGTKRRIYVFWLKTNIFT